MLQNMLIEQLSKFSKLQNFFEKKLEMFFFVILRILKVVRSAYFVTFFVTRMYKSSSVLKPALYTVVPPLHDFWMSKSKYFWRPFFLELEFFTQPWALVHPKKLFPFSQEFFIL